MSGMVQNKAPPLGRKPICPVLDAMCVPLSVLSAKVKWMCRNAEDMLYLRGWQSLDRPVHLDAFHEDPPCSNRSPKDRCFLSRLLITFIFDSVVGCCLSNDHGNFLYCFLTDQRPTTTYCSRYKNNNNNNILLYILIQPIDKFMVVINRPMSMQNMGTINWAKFIILKLNIFISTFAMLTVKSKIKHLKIRSWNMFPKKSLIWLKGGLDFVTAWLRIKFHRFFLSDKLDMFYNIQVRFNSLQVLFYYRVVMRKIPGL